MYMCMCIHLCLCSMYVCINTLAGTQRLEIHLIVYPPIFFHLIFEVESPSETGAERFDQTSLLGGCHNLSLPTA